jgi:hypothetical protein
MISILFLALAAQTTSTKLPPAKALPPPAAEEQAVLAPINRFFAALAAKDAAAMLAEAQPEGRLTGYAEGKPPVVRSWSEFTARFKPGEGPALLERFVGLPAIETDRDIAMVWSPYEFLIDGKVAHCGIDHFDLVRVGGQWKVLNITWTQRICPAR